MEYFIGLVSLISLGLNYLIFRRVTATYPIGTVEEFEFAPAHFCQCEAVKIEESETEPEVETTPSASKTHDYSAWRNEQNIPWSVPVKKPEPIIKTPDRGPLARPDGFV